MLVPVWEHIYQMRPYTVKLPVRLKAVMPGDIKDKISTIKPTIRQVFEQ